MCQKIWQIKYSYGKGSLNSTWICIIKNCMHAYFLLMITSSHHGNEWDEYLYRITLSLNTKISELVFLCVPILISLLCYFYFVQFKKYNGIVHWSRPFHYFSISSFCSTFLSDHVILGWRKKALEQNHWTNVLKKSSCSFSHFYNWWRSADIHTWTWRESTMRVAWRLMRLVTRSHHDDHHPTTWVQKRVRD